MGSYRGGWNGAIRSAATVAALALVALTLPGPAQAAARGSGAPDVAQTPSVPVTAAVSHYDRATPTASWRGPAPEWPAGTAQVELTGAAGPVHAGSLPVTLTQVAPAASKNTAKNAAQAAPAAVQKAAVRVEPRSAATAAGVDGVVLAVSRADGAAHDGSVQISLAYQQFADAYGGDWGQRLALVELPACALTTPNVPSCRVQHPVAFDNHGASRTLTATVSLPAAQTGSAQSAGPLVLAATSNTSSSSTSGGGDYTATSLKPSGSWSAGGATDAFTWSYPIATPQVPGNLAPDLALSYDSQAEDGLTSNTNNQAGKVGDGWDLTSSFIERSYASCHQNPSGPTQTYDNCWSNDDELTMDLNGQATALIKDDTTGDYVAESDPGERVQYETGAVNGAQNGEYWVVTAADGTKFYFGMNQLPGYAGGATTDSVDTEPVYATASGQPCWNATFSKSFCEQAYRWNLDYVVDAHSNAMSYWYSTTTGYYAQDMGTTAPASSAFTRDSVLTKIEYGQRAGQVYSTTPAGEVLLTANGRCDTSSTGCATSTLSSSTASSWPDVPYDLNCASGASCSNQSPSFWTADEITGIETEGLVGSALTPVDSWALTYAFPPITGTGDTSSPSLWLSTITHTGLDTTAEPSGAKSLALSSVVFKPTAMQNRVNLSDGYPWITRNRLTEIDTESGEKITVGYSAPACGSGTPTDDAQNTTLCYPVYWYPDATKNPTKDYFNKYIVKAVTEDDTTGGFGNDSITTTYTPVGGAAWHYNDDPLTPSAQRTWDQFRGYQGMVVSTGTAPDPVTKTQYTYFRGMDGDYLTSSSTRTASVTDTRGDPAVTDLDQYAGTAYETQVFNGSSVVTDTVTTPWTSAVVATHALSGGLPAQQAFYTGSADVRAYTPLASGATRETETRNTYDSYGRIVQADDLGDVTQPSQAQCTTTSYATNTTAWITDEIAETKTVAGDCSQTPVYPQDAVTDTLTYYDGSTTLGAAPTAGDATESLHATSYSGSTPQYTVTAKVTYDEYGRTLTTTDADNRTTTTGYTPATGAEPTSVKKTDPMGMATTTAYDPLRDLPTQVVDAGGYTSVEQYDALGRLTAVFKPGFPTSGPANLKYTYTMSDSAPSVTDTYTLNDDGSYRLSETLYDSLLRAREVQTSTPDGGRDIIDTYYDTDGWKSETTNSYYNSSAVTPVLDQAQAGVVPSATGYSYDADGRQTAEIAYADGTETWRTSYTYGGNFVTSVPPAGAAAQTVVTNALGQQTDLVQYLAGKPTDYVTDPASDYTDTRYTYLPNGSRSTETDAAGNQWSWTYDLLGNQLTSVSPDSGTTTNTFDAAGQLMSTTDARQKTTSYVYDKDGRQTAQYDTTGGAAETSADELASWTYDTLKKGLQTSTTSYSNGDTYTEQTMAYDAMGNPEATKYTLTGTDAGILPAAGYTVSYGYTYTGTQDVQDDPAIDGLPEENLTTGFDTYQQPVSLTAGGGTTWTYVSSVGYSEFDQPQQYTMPTVSGDVYVKEAYDPQTAALDSVQTTDSTSSAPIDQLTYVYGNASGTVSKGSGLLTQIDDVQNTAGNTGSGTAQTDTQCFTYDYAEHLSQAWTATDACAATPSSGASSTVGGAIAPYWQSWTYNAAGDRQTETDHDLSGNTANDTDVTYDYPAAGSSSDLPNALSSTSATGPNATAQTASYQYYPDGSEKSVTGGALGTESYAWNDAGQLQTTTSGSGATNYVYDSSGAQILVRDPSSTTLTIGDMQITNAGGGTSGVRFYVLGGVTVAERTSAGIVSVLIPNQQGTDLLAISTAASQAVTRRQYLPFGAVRGTGGAWVGGNQGYVGGQQDTTTGLETLGAREYDTADGRFLSVDPVFHDDDPSQLGGYDYAGNNPIVGEDPSGKDFLDDIIAALENIIKAVEAAAAPLPGKYGNKSTRHDQARDAAVVQIKIQLASMGVTNYKILLTYRLANSAKKCMKNPGAPCTSYGVPDILLEVDYATPVYFVWEVKSAGSAAKAVPETNWYVGKLRAQGKQAVPGWAIGGPYLVGNGDEVIGPGGGAIIYGRPNNKKYQKQKANMPSGAVPTAIPTPAPTATPTASATPSPVAGPAPGMYADTAYQPGLGTVPLAQNGTDWLPLILLGGIALAGTVAVGVEVVGTAGAAAVTCATVTVVVSAASKSDLDLCA